MEILLKIGNTRNFTKFDATNFVSHLYQDAWYTQTQMCHIIFNRKSIKIYYITKKFITFLIYLIHAFESTSFLTNIFNQPAHTCAI